MWVCLFFPLLLGKGKKMRHCKHLWRNDNATIDLIWMTFFISSCQDNMIAHVIWTFAFKSRQVVGLIPKWVSSACCRADFRFHLPANPWLCSFLSSWLLQIVKSFAWRLSTTSKCTHFLIWSVSTVSSFSFDPLHTHTQRAALTKSFSHFSWSAVFFM